MPFHDPAVVPWDVVRLYCSVGSVLVLVGGLVQLFNPMPGLVREIQVARGLFIIGTGAILLALISGGLARLGNPPNVPSVLVLDAVGVTVLLAWLRMERKGRKASQ